MPQQLPATPFLAIDLPVLEANIERIATWADDRGLSLRPHVKTHKSPEIAHRQVDAGARGLTVATIGEAEVFAQSGFDDLLIAYPLWLDSGRRERLGRLAAEADVRVGFDSAEAAARLAGVGVTGLLELDSGHHRSGVAPSGQARSPRRRRRRGWRWPDCSRSRGTATRRAAASRPRRRRPRRCGWVRPP